MTAVSQPVARIGNDGKATSRILWWFAVLVLVGTIIARIPALRGYVDERLAGAPGVAAKLTDDHLRSLAVNTGLGLALLISMVLFLLYQSLARTLEKHVFTKSTQWAGKRVGLFFLVEILAVLPPALLSALLGRVSLRGTWEFYAWMIVVGASVPWLYRAHWGHVSPGRKATLFSATILLALMGTLI